MKVLATLLLCAVALVGADSGYGARINSIYEDLPPLSSFDGFRNEFYSNHDGTYTFLYNLPHSERSESRSPSGEVEGHYAFKAPEGGEYEFKYDANDEGYHVESDALPQVPEDTDEVKAAKAAFFEAYERALELVESDESDDDDESDEDEESSEEDSSEEDDESGESEEEDESDERDSGAAIFFPSSGQPFGQRVPYPYQKK